VCFANLFGSQARQDAGKLSDIDIAIYLDHGIDGTGKGGAGLSLPQPVKNQQ